MLTVKSVNKRGLTTQQQNIRIAILYQVNSILGYVIVEQALIAQQQQ